MLQTGVSANQSNSLTRYGDDLTKIWQQLLLHWPQCRAEHLSVCCWSRHEINTNHSSSFVRSLCTAMGRRLAGDVRREVSVPADMGVGLSDNVAAIRALSLSARKVKIVRNQ